MSAVLIALVLLIAGVAAIYLLVRKMSEEGIEMAAPGSCRRGRCGVPSCQPDKETADATLPVADGDETINALPQKPERT